MKTFLLAILAFQTLTLAHGESLLLETERDVFRADETITVVLRLDGATIDPALKDTPGFIPPSKEAAIMDTAVLGTTSGTELSCRFRLKFENAGEHILGPYSLKLAGKVLQSNRKIIRIIPSENSNPEASFDHSDVKVGSEFTLFIVTKGKNIEGVKWRENPMVKGGGVTTSTSMSIAEGKTSTSTTYKVTFTALKTGIFEVSPDSFDGLPSEWKFDTISLKIRK